MCESRHWKHIFAYENNGHLIIGGTRTDNVLFQVHTNNIDNEDKSIMALAKLAIMELESYRSCQCTATEKCRIHKEQK